LAQSAQPVSPVAANVVEAFGTLAQQRGLSLTLVTDDSLWTCMPAEALERVLMNLLSNAVKFTGDGGVIRLEIEAGEGDSQLRMRVSDTGMGIPTDRLTSVFERFQRVDVHAEGIPGSGIGLALVHELVTAYDGSIEVDSGHGTGTVFTVLLPRFHPSAGLRVQHEAPRSEALQLEVDALEQPAADADSGLGDDHDERPSVLVIEDNRDMRDYLAQLLGGEFQVLPAATGEAGLELADREIPDLVICDLTLPGRDGFDVVRTLRGNTATSHIPIIMLTARSDHESRLRGLREQVDDFLVKPFNDEELLLRVGNLLAIRDILRARFGGAMMTGGVVSVALKGPEGGFLDKLTGVLETHHANEGFSIVAMAADMAMSERQLQRKLKAITDQSPALYLRLFRLRRSLLLLAEGRRISDVSDAVGFSSPAYFASCFRAQFNCTPSEYQVEPSRIQA
jgi:DNA-binding response OmpR family regulator/anti-sigma regulatory factor (Ser/Thr protein kinase)